MESSGFDTKRLNQVVPTPPPPPPPDGAGADGAGAAAATLTVAVYVSIFVPFAAVTRTVTILAPVTNPVLPEIIRDAPDAVGVATTVTDVVPFGTVTELPA